MASFSDVAKRIGMDSHDEQGFGISVIYTRQGNGGILRILGNMKI